MFGQRIPQSPVALMDGIPPAEYDYVQISKQLLMMAKAFPDNTLDTVPVNSPFGTFFRDRKAQSSPVQTVGPA